jgi:hypothetical protein
MASISINGKVYVGNSIHISNNRVVIDGIDQTPDSKNINIVVEGNVATLEADVCDTVTVNEHVGSISTQTGDVEVSGNVSGDIKTQTGDVKCEAVGGNVKTQTGDIKYRK